MYQSQPFFLKLKIESNNIYNYLSKKCYGQDQLIDMFFDYKSDGFFLDIGAHDYRHISNTYFFETQKNWSGIAIELDKNFEQGWLYNRKKSIFLSEDALNINYSDLFKKYNITNADYLSLDLDPPEITLNALYKVFDSDIKFNSISFEVDDYRQKITKDESRKFLKSKNYILVAELYGGPEHERIHVDDFWIHKSFESKIDSFVYKIYNDEV